MSVVNDRNKLVQYIFKLANNESIEENELSDLKRCLENSGERRKKIDLKTFNALAARWRPIIYYGGTAFVCLSAMSILIRLYNF